MKKNLSIFTFNINVCFKSDKGSKDMTLYNILNQGHLLFVVAARRKWEFILNKVVRDWKKIRYCVGFNTELFTAFFVLILYF